MASDEDMGGAVKIARSRPELNRIRMLFHALPGVIYLAFVFALTLWVLPEFVRDSSGLQLGAVYLGYAGAVAWIILRWAFDAADWLSLAYSVDGGAVTLRTWRGRSRSIGLSEIDRVEAHTAPFLLVPLLPVYRHVFAITLRLTPPRSTEPFYKTPRPWDETVGLVTFTIYRNIGPRAKCHSDGLRLLEALSKGPARAKFDPATRALLAAYEVAKATDGEQSAMPQRARDLLLAGDAWKAMTVLIADARRRGQYSDIVLGLSSASAHNRAILPDEAVRREPENVTGQYYLALTYPSPVRADGTIDQPLSDRRRRLLSEAREHWQAASGDPRYAEQAGRELRDINAALEGRTSLGGS